MKTTKNINILDTLSPADQEKLMFWLETEPYRTVLERIAAPRPEGFGLHTHLTTLCRYYARHQKTEEPEITEIVGDLAATELNPTDLDRVTAASVRRSALQLAASPQLDPKKFKALANWVLKLREQEQHDRALDLAEKRYQLAKAEFEFNAAREALNHAVDLNEIIDTKTIDDEEKINRARRRLFGRLPEDNPPPSVPAPVTARPSPAPARP